MWVATSNIKGTMRPSKVAEDMAHVAHLASVFFFQEITYGFNKRLLHRLFARVFYIAALARECPVVLKKAHWEILDVHVSLAHKGRPLCSPNRYIVVVLARRRGSQKVVAFISTHYISGAWNRKRKTFKKWRRAMWLRHHSLHQTIVDILVSAGISVVGGADWNRLIHQIRPLHKDMEWVAAGGIDGVYIVEAPSGTRIRVHEEDVERGLNTDHALRRARLTFRAGSMEEQPTRLPRLPSAA